MILQTIRKTLLILFAILSASTLCLAGDYTLHLHPRAETRVSWNQTDGYQENIAYSSINSVFQANFDEHFSFKMCNRWFRQNAGALYTSLGDPKAINWIDTGILTYRNGRFLAGIGKAYVIYGGYEIDAVATEFHYDIESSWWQTVQPYLWGIKLGYEVAPGNTLCFQVADSPFCKKVLSDGLVTLSGSWTGKIGNNYAPLWAFTMTQRDDKSFIKTLALGNRFTYDRLSAELDYTVSTVDMKRLFNNESTVTLKVAYEGDRFEFHLKGGWDARRDGKQLFDPSLTATCYGPLSITPLLLAADKDLFFGGFYTYWFPLKDRSLRFHLVGSTNNYYKGVAFDAGILYDICIHWGKK